MGLVVEVLLLAGAWFGHAFLLTVVLNIAYALPVRRWILKRLRELIALLVFGFPVALAWRFWGRFGELIGSSAGRSDFPVFCYLFVCWATTFIYLPAVTVVRARRRDPSQLSENHGHV